MISTLRWSKGKEEGTLCFYCCGGKNSVFAVYRIGENEVEICTKKLKAVSQMGHYIKTAKRRLKRYGITKYIFLAEAGTPASRAYDSTKEVRYRYSEFMMKKPGSVISPEVAELSRLSVSPTEDGVRFAGGISEEEEFTCLASRYRDGWYVYEVLVKEESRGQGIGTAGMWEVLRLLERHTDAASLVCFAAKNRVEDLIGSYAGNGMNIVSAHPEPYGTACTEFNVKKQVRGNPVYLQVGSYNAVALHLYQKLGFVVKTELRYYF